MPATCTVPSGTHPPLRSLGDSCRQLQHGWLIGSVLESQRCPIALALQIVAWFVILSVFMSLVEHQVHARLMHRKPRFFLFRNLRARTRMFTSHALEHHRQYREEFHDEPVPHGEDRGIRLNVLEGLVESLPAVLVLAPFTTVGAVVFPIVVCLHHLTWNLVHLEMHKPEGRFFGGWPLFQRLARHHYLHHRYPGKNFNVFLLVGDYVFGTMAKPTEEDWAEMRRQGLAPDSLPVTSRAEKSARDSRSSRAAA